MFGHQYSHVWIDFRGIQDEYMREKGIDYFENSRRAAYAHREYAIQNPMRWRGYDSEIWGLTACDGPADTVQIFNNEERGFFTYAARGTAATHLLDDGTIAPTAAVASIAFAPEIVIPTIRAFRARFGENLYQKYGFLDAVNPSFTFTNVPLRHGRIVENVGWIANDYLGIDQGPIVAMIENYRSGLIWKLMQRNPHIRRGLERAGFTGGWLAQPPPPPSRARDSWSNRRQTMLAVAALAAAPLGCTRRSQAANVVRFWAVGREGEYAVELLKDFLREQPDIDVEVQKLPWTAAHEKLLTAYAGETLPDLCSARQHLDAGVRRAECARAAR